MAANCTLPGFAVESWTSSTIIPTHMGLPTRWDREGQDRDFLHPLEPIEEEGCPGGWYRSGFVRSLHKYRRRGGEQKTENLFLTRCQDRLVLEAIAYLEDEEGHSLSAFLEARDADG